MGLEVVLIVLGVTLLGGMFVAIAAACQEPADDAGDAEDAAVPKAKILVEDSSGFYADPVADDLSLSDDNTVLHIEHYLRRERLRAQRFADRPSTESLLHDYDSVWKRGASN